jgi:hypothetical protein
MGITSTFFLLLQGYDVELISNLFPESDNIFLGREEHITSQIAGGLVLPLYYDRGGSTDNYRMIKETWELVKKLEATTEYLLFMVYVRLINPNT